MINFLAIVLELRTFELNFSATVVEHFKSTYKKLKRIEALEKVKRWHEVSCQRSTPAFNHVKAKVN